MNFRKLLSVTNSLNITENFDEDKRKKQLIEKMAITLRLQYNNIFKERNYQIKNLINDLRENINSHDMNHLPYDYHLIKIEQIILENLTKRHKNISKSNDNWNKSNVNNKNNINNSQNDFTNLKNKNNEINDYYPNNQKLFIKQKDDWLKIAKYNDLKAKDEDNLLRKNDIDTKKNYQESIAKQVEDKQKDKQKENEKEYNYYKQHLDKIKNLDQIAKEKKDYNLKKIQEDKEVLNTMINGKSKNIEVEKIKNKEDSDKDFKDFTNQIKKEESDLNLKNLEKKNRCRDILKKEYDQYQKNKSIEILNTTNIKLNEKYQLDNDNKFVNSSDKLSHHKKIKSYVEELKSSQKINETIKLHRLKALNDENEKLKKEYMIKSLREIDWENHLKTKKNDLKINVNLTLKTQVRENSENRKKEKYSNENIDKDILRNFASKNKNEDDKMMIKNDLIHKYKTDLNRQIADNNSKFSTFIDENEKLYNKNIFDEIKNYNSPL